MDFLIGTGQDALHSDELYSDEEELYWKDRAALIDPSAYVHYQGTNINITVPAGETWYALNLWHIQAGTKFLFLREMNANAPLILPPGTVLRANGSQEAFAYICKPSLVTGNDKYQLPKKLYFSRINKLRTMALSELSAAMTAAQPQGAFNTTSFPSDFENGLITLASVHDVSWVILNHSVSGNSANLLNEVSDDHQMREAVPIMAPFKRADFDRIKVRAASVLGQASGFSSLAGYGVVKYYKLPADW